jgi:hypothetical protein
VREDPLHGLGVRMTVRVAPTARSDDEAGPYGGQKRIRRGSRGAVVSCLEDQRVQHRRSRRAHELCFPSSLEITGEQSRQILAAAPVCDEGAVVLARADGCEPAGPRRKHRERSLKEIEWFARPVRTEDRTAARLRRRHQSIEPFRPGRLGLRHDQRAGERVANDRGEPTHVILIAVGRDRGAQGGATALAQRAHGEDVCVRRFEHPAIHEGGACARLQEHGVPLADVEKGDPLAGSEAGGGQNREADKRAAATRTRKAARGEHRR